MTIADIIAPLSNETALLPFTLFFSIPAERDTIFVRSD